MMTPEEVIKEAQELEEDKRVYPPFLVEEFRKIREEIRIEEKTGKSIPYHPTKVTDFIQLICATFVISNKSYQEEYWGKHGQWGDNFGETMETFRMNCESVLDTDDIIKMTPNISFSNFFTFKDRSLITEYSYITL